MATRLMPRPTSESHPSASDTATAIGTSVSDSSRIPAVDDSSIQTKITMAISRYLRFWNRRISDAMMYCSTPTLSRIRNEPPMKKIIRMIAMPVVAWLLVKQRIGESTIFQTFIL